jgi:hypothetical protein
VVPLRNFCTLKATLGPVSRDVFAIITGNIPVGLLNVMLHVLPRYGLPVCRTCTETPLNACNADCITLAVARYVMSAVVMLPSPNDSVNVPPTTGDAGIRVDVRLKSTKPLIMSKSTLITVNNGNAVGLAQRKVTAHLNPDGPDT